ncbi:MAG TPA: hypothetical protein VKQ11_14450 [Candidatus Sulfotelmatobacter sp.]|nr:hypothetical protein [Candidatus Sulfotelmatobacter sp.]
MNTKANFPERDIPRNRLWFGFSGAAVAWIIAGLADAWLAWVACMGHEVGSGVFTSVGMRVLLGAITFGLLAVATAGGLVSFNNWRRLSQSREFLEAEGRGRQQFMALVGVFISVSLGVGIVWFAIPIYILGICVRAR